MGIDGAFCIRGLAPKITHRAFPFKVISKSNSETPSNWFISSTQLFRIWGVVEELFSKVLLVAGSLKSKLPYSGY